MHRVVVRRTARYYLLGDRHAADRWLVCHGYGQLARTFATYFGPIAAPERLIVAPEALSRFYNGNGAGPVGASWMTREDRVEEIHDYLQYLDRVLEDLDPAPPDARLRVLGFSQGTATAGRWALGGRRMPDEVILWGGAPPDEWFHPDAAERLAAMRIRLVSGDGDNYAPPGRLEAARDRLRDAGVPAELLIFPGGHRLDRAVLGRIASNQD